MAKEPLIVFDGARVSIDGVDILVILAPWTCDAAENQEVVAKLLGLFQFPVVFANRQADGEYSFAGLGQWPEKLRAKNASDLHWTKIPLYPPEEGPEPFHFPVLGN